MVLTVLLMKIHDLTEGDMSSHAFSDAPPLSHIPSSKVSVLFLSVTSQESLVILLIMEPRNVTLRLLRLVCVIKYYTLCSLQSPLSLSLLFSLFKNNSLSQHFSIS